MSEYLHNPELGPLNDFRNFLVLVFMHLKLPSPTQTQFEIAEYLQYGPRNSIIMAFRGIGKSLITVAYVCWLWLINPQFKILVLSATEKKAVEFAQLVKQLVDGMPLLAHLRPGRGQRDSVMSFDVGPALPAKDPSLNVAGINGMVTGGRADFIIPDDVEIVANSATVTMREKLLERIGELTPLLKTDPWVSIKALGTPQSEESVYYKMVKERNFDIKVWPARYPQDTARYEGRLWHRILDELDKDPSLVGKPTDVRFTETLLRERELSMSKAWFQLQFMLDPTLADVDRYPLRLSDLIVMSISPDLAPVNVAWGLDERYMVKDVPVVGFNGDRYYRPMFAHNDWVPYDYKLMAIDPSGRGSDETAYVVLYLLKGWIYVAEWGGIEGTGYAEDNLVKMANIAKKHKVNEIIVESNFGDGMFSHLFAPTLARIHSCSLEEVRSTGQKEKRVCDTLEPILGSHRLIVSDQAIKEDYEAKQELQGFYQLTRITRERGALRHDDRIDVLAIGCARLGERLAVDASKLEDQRQMDLLDKQLSDFMQAALGPSWTPNSQTWCSFSDSVL